jgi:hypothetical protein
MMDKVQLRMCRYDMIDHYNNKRCLLPIIVNKMDKGCFSVSLLFSLQKEHNSQRVNSLRLKIVIY